MHEITTELNHGNQPLVENTVGKRLNLHEEIGGAALIDSETWPLSMEQLKEQDFDWFNKLLLVTRNSDVVMGRKGTKPEENFVTSQNGTVGGKKYPRAEDKEGLLRYCFEQAKQAGDINDAALILAFGVQAVHPYKDGNGRTARRVYELLSGEEPSRESSVLKTGSMSRDHRLDGAFFSYSGARLKEMAVRSLIQEQGVELIGDSSYPFLYGDGVNQVVTPFAADEYDGLNDEESSKLDKEFGIADAGYEGFNSQAVLHGFSMLAHRFPELLEKLTFIDDARFGRRIIVSESLRVLNRDQKLALTDSINDYYTLEAKAVIDILGKHGNKTLNTEQGKMSIRDFVRLKSNVPKM